MEKKQGGGGFFSEIVRSLSPSRSRRSSSPISSLLRRSKKCNVSAPDRSISMRFSGEALAPLMEGPDPDNNTDNYLTDGSNSNSSNKRVGLGKWVMGQLASSGRGIGSGSGLGSGNNNRKCDLRLLLGVMGAPLGPVHVIGSDPMPHLSIKDIPIESSSAQYILQQYTAASGGQKLQNIRNAYAMGKVKMLASEFETATRVMKNRNSARDAESGGFVLWQMDPDMWYVELAVGGSKVHAGCNGKIVWRHTPWLGAHTAKGPVRPLRRALQGLDPRTTASMFTNARCIGEKKINGEDCFILKLCADPLTLKSRSEGPAEIIRHVLFGYFSHKTGLLVHMEDSHLTRIQSNGGDAVYWETTINSFLEDYKPVEGIMIAHSGRSVVTLFRFGEQAMSHTKTRMEEAWTIDEVAFNVPGLSLDCFIPPADLRSGSISEACELPLDERANYGSTISSHRSKVAAIEKDHNGNVDNLIWKMEKM